MLNGLLCKKSKFLPDYDSDNALAEAFSNHFITKVECLRTRGSVNNYNLNAVSHEGGQQFNEFSPVSSSDIKHIVKRAKKTYCILDPLDTSKLYEVFLHLSDVIATIVNAAFLEGTFPDELKLAIVTPLIKSTYLDKNILGNYRPISNISFLSKIFELCMLEQIENFPCLIEMIPLKQSAYKKSQSTETALYAVQND